MMKIRHILAINAFPILLGFWLLVSYLSIWYLSLPGHNRDPIFRDCNSTEKNYFSKKS